MVDNYNRYKINSYIVKKHPDNGGQIHYSMYWFKEMKTNYDDIIHIVEVNEMLDYIAYKYYNDERLWWIIAEFNNIKMPLDIYPRQVLRFPSYKRIINEILVK